MRYVKRCAKYSASGKCIRIKRVAVRDTSNGSSSRRGRHCVMFGRRSDGTRYCKKYSTSSGGLSGLGSSGRRCVRYGRVYSHSLKKTVRRCMRYA